MSSNVQQTAEVLAELRQALINNGTVPDSEVPVIVGSAGGVLLALRP